MQPTQIVMEAVHLVLRRSKHPYLAHLTGRRNRHSPDGVISKQLP